jgi:hypothetical protein
MHPTRDTLLVINLSGAGGRVMPGVGRLVAEMESQGKAGRVLIEENSCVC